MTTNALITPNPITDDQKSQIVGFAEAAAKKAITTLNLDNPAAQCVIRRGDELKAAIIAKISELSLLLSDLSCFGIADWQKYYKLGTPEQVATVGDFPWSDAVLNSPCPFNPGKMVRETHFAFAGLENITIMELKKMNPKETEPRFYSYAQYAWYFNEKFATKTSLAARWYLMLRGIVPGSENRTFNDQKAMLPPEYEIPSAVAEVAKDILMFKKTGVYANPSRYARTADVVSHGLRVDVGGFGPGGLIVDRNWDVSGDDRLGLACSRKSKK